MAEKLVADKDINKAFDQSMSTPKLMMTSLFISIKLDDKDLKVTTVIYRIILDRYLNTIM